MTQQTPATIGFLVPIPRYESSPKIPVLKEGDTFLGRCHLSIDDKRVSRKQIKLCGSSSTSSNTGAVEIVVEGQNPVVILSLGSHERRKLCLGERSFLKFGDIIELIPGSYSYMYVKVDNECKILETEKGMGKRMCDNRIENVKRNRQIAEDEAFARCLQDEGEGNKSFRAQSKSYNVSAPRNHLQPIQHFRVSKDQSALKFRLMRVQSLPPWANTSSVSIGDVIQGIDEAREMLPGLVVVRGDAGGSGVYDARSTSNLPGGIGDYECVIDDLLRVLLWIGMELIPWNEPGGPLL